MTFSQILAVVIFAVAYILIATNLIEKTRVALAGAALMLVFKLVDQHTAFHGTETVHGIDWNTIFLLMGMMVIVGVTRHTGLLQWIAIRTAKLVRGSPVGMIMAFSAVTAVLSAFLDNVTTVLIIAPMILLICDDLEIDPVPYLISIVLASNIGGTATLIGDPPNIMIGSAAKLNFMDFIRYDTPPAAIVLVLFLAMLWVGLGPRLKVRKEARDRVLELDEREALRDPVLLRKCLAVFALVLVGFVVHGPLHLEPGTIALAGAALLLLLIGRTSPDPDQPDDYHWYHEIEWPTIFFFIGLFIMVSALANLGILEALGHWVAELAGGNMLAMTMILLWFSGLAVAVVNNVAFVAPMNAILLQLHNEMFPGMDNPHDPTFMPLWWALSLGACLGANLTPIATAANVVVMNIGERNNHHISFRRFFKYSIPVVTMSLIVSTIYLWLVFFR